MPLPLTLANGYIDNSKYANFECTHHVSDKKEQQKPKEKEHKELDQDKDKNHRLRD